MLRKEGGRWAAALTCKHSPADQKALPLCHGTHACTPAAKPPPPLHQPSHPPGSHDSRAAARGPAPAAVQRLLPGLWLLQPRHPHRGGPGEPTDPAHTHTRLAAVGKLRPEEVPPPPAPSSTPYLAARPAAGCASRAGWALTPPRSSPAPAQRHPPATQPSPYPAGQRPEAAARQRQLLGLEPGATHRPHGAAGGDAGGRHAPDAALQGALPQERRPGGAVPGLVRGRQAEKAEWSGPEQAGCRAWRRQGLHSGFRFGIRGLATPAVSSTINPTISSSTTESSCSILPIAPDFSQMDVPHVCWAC